MRFHAILISGISFVMQKRCTSHTVNSLSRAVCDCWQCSKLWRKTTESEVNKNYDCCFNEENARERSTLRSSDT